MRFLLPLLLTFTFIMGCPAHVALGEIPDATAPLADRAEAYDRLRPTQRLQSGNGWGAQQTLLLNSGVIVAKPRDLLAAVKPNAQTALHADRAEDLDDASRALWVTSVGITTVGLLGQFGVIAASAPVIDNQPGLSRDEELVTWAELGAAGVAVVGLLVMIPAGMTQLAATDERNMAFASYDADLKKRLALVPKKSSLTDLWDGEE